MGGQRKLHGSAKGLMGAMAWLLNKQETCKAGAEKVEGDVERKAFRSCKVSEATGKMLTFFLRAEEGV